MRLLFLIAMAASLKWEERAPMPVGVVGHAGGMAGGKFVTAGGTWWPDGVKTWSNRADWYDAEANRWRTAPPLPYPVAYAASVGGPGGLEIFGANDGQRNHRECLVLDPGLKGWRVNGALPEDKLMAGAASVDGAAYLIGGCGDPQGLTDCTAGVLARDAGGRWSAGPPIPSGPVALPATAVAGGRIYLFGGAYLNREKNVVNRDEAWSYDPAAKRWKALRRLPAASRGVVAATVDDGRVLLAGGYTGTFQSTVLVYEIASDSYREMGPLPSAVLAMAVGRIGDWLYLAGGEDAPKQRSARVFRALLRDGR